MTDKPEEEKDDGTVILTGAPPRLRPQEPSAQEQPLVPASSPAGAAQPGSEIPAPPTIRPREGAPSAPAAAPIPPPPAAPPPSPPSSAPTAPPSPAAPGSAPSAGDADDEGDVTQVLVRSEPARESTVILNVPPPNLGARTPPAAAPPKPAAAGTPPPQAPAATQAATPPPPPQAPAAAQAAAPAAKPAQVPASPPVADPSDATRTILVRSPDAETVNWSAREAAWISLEHVLPSDHAGSVRVDKKVSTVGRSLDCDLRLYSASASRQHATIEQRGNDWVLVPMDGRRVLVDGELVDDEIVLQPGMRLGLGDDELVVLDQEEPAEAESRPRAIRGGLVALVTLGSGVALYVLLQMLGFI